MDRRRHPGRRGLHPERRNRRLIDVIWKSFRHPRGSFNNHIFSHITVGYFLLFLAATEVDRRKRLPNPGYSIFIFGFGSLGHGNPAKLPIVSPEVDRLNVS